MVKAASIRFSMAASYPGPCGNSRPVAAFKLGQAMTRRPPPRQDFNGRRVRLEGLMIAFSNENLLSSMARRILSLSNSRLQ